jgi:hypothetical protein
LLEIFDSCSIGIKKEPQGGVVFVFTDIVGRDGVSVMVPIEGKETAQAVADQIQELIGPRIIANLQDMKEMTHGAT